MVLDIETTGVSFEKSGVWYACATPFLMDAETLEVEIVGEHTLFYHLPKCAEDEIGRFWILTTSGSDGRVLYVEEVHRLKGGEPEIVVNRRRFVSVEPISSFKGNKIFEEDDEFFARVLKWADVLVAHNTRFEKGFLRRLGVRVPPSFCTMRNARMVMRKPHPRYGYKYPTLEEASAFFRCRELVPLNENFHDARYDARVTLELFVRLLAFYRTVVPERVEEMINTLLGRKHIYIISNLTSLSHTASVRR